VSGEALRPASGGKYCWFAGRLNSRLCGAGLALVVQSFLQPAIAAPDASIQVAALPLVPLLPGEFAPIPAEAAPGEPSPPLVPLVAFAFPVPFAPFAPVPVPVAPGEPLVALVPLVAFALPEPFAPVPDAPVPAPAAAPAAPAPAA
jgi:hypothetical protein